jgi:hypothetical protein
MNHKNKFFTAIALVGMMSFATSASRAEIVNVSVKGSVEWNFIGGAPLNGAHVNDAAELTFSVDSNNFSNNPQFPTRGYPIIQDSFKLTFPTFSIGLMSPYPAGTTPYFVLRNNDPAVDGFLISDGTGFPDGVSLNQSGAFGPFANEFHATYPGSTLASLDILGALGHYDFTGLSVFNWTLDDGPNNPMGILYNDMTISAVPEPTTALLIAPIAMLALPARRRRGQR